MATTFPRFWPGSCRAWPSSRRCRQKGRGGAGADGEVRGSAAAGQARGSGLAAASADPAQAFKNAAEALIGNPAAVNPDFQKLSGLHSGGEAAGTRAPAKPALGAAVAAHAAKAEPPVAAAGIIAQVFHAGTLDARPAEDPAALAATLAKAGAGADSVLAQAVGEAAGARSRKESDAGDAGGGSAGAASTPPSSPALSAKPSPPALRRPPRSRRQR